jgi:hypothetical protein
MTEIAPQTEVEAWSRAEIGPSDERWFLRKINRAVMDTFNRDCDQEEVAIRHTSGVLDENGLPASVIDLSYDGSLQPAPENEDTPFWAWTATLHIDEALKRLTGYPKPASVYRRTLVLVQSDVEPAFRIVRSHELKRRSQHKWARPKNAFERKRLSEFENFDRTALQRQDRTLIKAAISTLFTISEVPDEIN